MGTGGRELDRDPAARTEVLHASERTRVTRLFLPGRTIIRKQPQGRDAQQRLQHELAMLERLRGVAGVAQLADAPQYEDSIVLDDVAGTPLGDVPKPVEDVIGLALQLARAVAAMHSRGVMHRDIAPANILVSCGDAARLVDFALATSLAEIRPDFTHHSEIVGTLEYLAPEQTGRTGRAVDQRSDLYALGATLYELATGAPPFGAGDALQLTHDHLARVPVPPAEANPAIPAALSDVIMHLLEKEPDHRYQSAQGLVHDLERLKARPAAGALRVGEYDAPVRLRAPSRLIGRDQAEVPHVQLGDLPSGDLVAMVAEMLRTDGADAADLVELIEPHSRGNPYETVELLDALRRDGLLAAAAGGWRWEPAAVRAHLGEVAGIPAARAGSLPASARELLEAMACLGGRAELSLLQVATGAPEEVLDRRLAPAADAGVLVTEAGAHPAVRFRHDRIREGILRRLDPRRRRRLQLAAARPLARVPALFVVAAEQYLPVTGEVTDADERRALATGATGPRHGPDGPIRSRRTGRAPAARAACDVIGHGVVQPWRRDGYRAPWPGALAGATLGPPRRKEGAMSVPGGPGAQLGSSLEPDPRNDPSLRVPKPLPDRGRRAGRTAIALLIAALIVVVLIVPL